uniref:Uncharacterized protein n=1 Tax=Physcomitrium patens TaxID=3218 RepID=A0A2K1J9A1_PHYPA|nr:hypothetical protein PHYPA_021221 [Physcomitrium patens]
MKHAITQKSESEAAAPKWDAGSTLFDSFEFDSLMKTLDQAVQVVGSNPTKEAADGDADHDEAPPMIVVYSPKHSTNRPDMPHAPPQRLYNQFYSRSFPVRRDGVDECQLDAVNETRSLQRARSYNLVRNGDYVYDHGYDDGEGKDRQLFDSSKQETSKGGCHRQPDHHHHHNKWKSFLHSLHLDGGRGGLFHSFHRSHSQVVPDESLKTRDHRNRGRKPFEESEYGLGAYSDTSSEEFDAHFHRNNVHVSKDVDIPSDKDDDDHGHHHLYFWKFVYKAILSSPFCRQRQLLSEAEESEMEEKFYENNKELHQGHHYKRVWSSLSSMLRHHDRNHENEHQLKHNHIHHGQSHDSKHDLIHGDEHPSLQRQQHEEHKHQYQHHRYHHHHYHYAQSEFEDFELTIQAKSRRSSRSSFEEKARRFSIEGSDSPKAPRNSLEDRDRTWVNPWEATKIGNLSKDSLENFRHI